MIGPPTNSAAAKRQPISTISESPSSKTRLVEANSKAITARKSAPLRKSVRAIATAAYEHDDEAAPSPVAIAMLRGPPSGISFATFSRDTVACTNAESPKPRMSAHSICQPIKAPICNARPISFSQCMESVDAFGSTFW